ncbi:MAG: UDP-N-acetylmuramoyl-tripeptide--D-alanyl-D-alanine ligase [Oscillospiraceae bacterium]|nr:UDP-N-acetylmuramoyl-tripeptide--D-alanyl-D-alanine ligase [Oscillospiraceae bacterium]
MAKITLDQAAAWCGGWVDPKYADVTFLGASNDSRNIQPGQLFLALQGVRDGHDFIPMAMEKGAAAVLCSCPQENIPAIVVEDVRIALGQIAAGERQRIGMKVVGVTGSVGKSTTKEMIACVLSSVYRVAKTPANHNNDIGMPMAVLAMPEDAQVAVLEMGMNHFGEISYLTNIAKPDVAVIINIGTMHIEHLGSQAGILKAKLEILEGLQPGGQLMLYGDDTHLWSVRDSLTVKPVYFGSKNPDCAVKASNVHFGENVAFTASWANGFMNITIPVEGEHYVSDALAAVSVGLAMGVAPEKIVDALANFRNMEGRQEIFEAKGYTIIKDCYNAGPESMAAAMAVLGNRPGRKIAVLGDMLELGVCAPAEHYKVGRIAAEKADALLAYGPNSTRMISGALTGGMAEGLTGAYTDRDALVAALKRLVKPGDVLLFKGSHGMHMEIALEKFLKDET